LRDSYARAVLLFHFRRCGTSACEAAFDARTRLASGPASERFADSVIIWPGEKKSSAFDETGQQVASPRPHRRATDCDKRYRTHGYRLSAATLRCLISVARAYRERAFNFLLAHRSCLKRGTHLCFADPPGPWLHARCCLGLCCARQGSTKLDAAAGRAGSRSPG
jgi:hypothetical protein